MNMQEEPKFSFKESSIFKKDLIKLRNDFNGQTFQKNIVGVSSEDAYVLKRNDWLTKVVSCFEEIIAEGYLGEKNMELITEMRTFRDYVISPDLHNKPATDLSDMGIAIKLVNKAIENL